MTSVYDFVEEVGGAAGKNKTLMTFMVLGECTRMFLHCDCDSCNDNHLVISFFRLFVWTIQLSESLSL